MISVNERIAAVYGYLKSKGRKRVTVNDIVTFSLFNPDGTLFGNETEIREFLKAKMHEATTK